MIKLMYKILFFNFLILSSCQTPKSISDAIDVDKSALVTEADAYLQQEPVTITAFLAERSAGGLHDYYSEGPYWWENPEDPEGPYIRRDGYRNPSNFTKHASAMNDMKQAVSTLVAAYKVTGDEKYAQRALQHLQAWFVNADTKMNPSLLYGQAIKGIVTGRGIGLIDTVKLIQVALSILELQQSGFLKGQELAAIKDWFDQFATWMTTHPYGIDERDNGNNHSAWWAAQVAVYAKVADRDDLFAMAQEQFKIMLPEQMAADGSFPEELARTRPYGYTIYNLEAWTNLAYLASTDKENLWNYQSENGSLRKAIDFFVPFMQDKSTWTLPPDVSGFDGQPRQSDFLVLASIGYNDETYLNLWQKLGKEGKSQAWNLLLY